MKSSNRDKTKPKRSKFRLELKEEQRSFPAKRVRQKNLSSIIGAINPAGIQSVIGSITSGGSGSASGSIPSVISIATGGSGSGSPGLSTSDLRSCFGSLLTGRCNEEQCGRMCDFASLSGAEIRRCGLMVLADRCTGDTGDCAAMCSMAENLRNGGTSGGGVTGGGGAGGGDGVQTGGPLTGGL